jgi:hypothetical protein
VINGVFANNRAIGIIFTKNEGVVGGEGERSVPRVHKDLGDAGAGQRGVEKRPLQVDE